MDSALLYGADVAVVSGMGINSSDVFAMPQGSSRLSVLVHGLRLAPFPVYAEKAVV
jgi:hypothetical protein